MFKKFVVIFFIVKDLLSCENLIHYYEILKNAKESYQNQKYTESLFYFQKIENCERFYNIENDIFIYSLTIKEICMQTLSWESKSLECKKLVSKMIRLLNLSLKMLLPEKQFLKDRSERYFNLGLAHFYLENCLEAKKSFLKSLELYPTKENQKYYESLTKLCPNG
ncbi:MAG: hypothetical protein ACK4UJ_08335 [Leptonema sp. (in: bacteria)]